MDSPKGTGVWGGCRAAPLRAALLAAFLAAATSLSRGQEKAAPAAGGDARPAVEAGHRTFIGALSKGDAAAVAALHASDARLMPEGGRPVEGMRDVEAFWRGVMGARARLVQLQTLSLEERGDLAYETGDYVMTAESSPGVTQIHSGNYLVVWRREGAEWKVAAAIWNAGRDAEGREAVLRARRAGIPSRRGHRASWTRLVAGPGTLSFRTPRGGASRVTRGNGRLLRGAAGQRERRAGDD